jgi:hypothetical protein
MILGLLRDKDQRSSHRSPVLIAKIVGIVTYKTRDVRDKDEGSTLTNARPIA